MAMPYGQYGPYGPFWTLRTLWSLLRILWAYIELVGPLATLDLTLKFEAPDHCTALRKGSKVGKRNRVPKHPL